MPQPPEFSFISQRHYVEQERDRIPMSSIRNNEIYTAVASLARRTSRHEAVSFPVMLDSIVLPKEYLARNQRIAQVTMRLFLLDEHFEKSDHPARVGVIQDGHWGVEPALQPNKRGVPPFSSGYLLFSLPVDPFTVSTPNQDPRSI